MRLFIFFILLFLISISTSGQRGFQFGLGFLTTSGSSKLINTEYSESIYVSNLHGLSLHTDYTFSNKFRIKSGLEYQFQNISVNKIFDFRAEYFSIPVIINYNFLNFKKFGLLLGIDAGLTFDKAIHYQESYYFSSQNNSDISNMKVVMETDVTYPRKAFSFNNITYRLGLNIKKDIRKHGHFNFFIHKNFQNWENFGILVNIEKQAKINNVIFPEIQYEKFVKLKSHDFQFGIYYTFGTLTFKQP